MTTSTQAPLTTDPSFSFATAQAVGTTFPQASQERAIACEAMILNAHISMDQYRFCKHIAADVIEAYMGSIEESEGVTFARRFTK